MAGTTVECGRNLVEPRLFIIDALPWAAAAVRGAGIEYRSTPDKRRFGMFLEEYYDADEIFQDVDSLDEGYEEEDVRELTFENPQEAKQGLSYLTDEVDQAEELFAE